jgi:hypothetical protein
MSDHNYWMERAQRALGGNRVQDAVAKTRAIVGPLTIPASETDAEEAWKKLSEGQQPSPDELAALEIVIRVLRPSPLSKNGILDDLPDKPGQNLQPQQLKDQWSTFRNLIKPLLYSIGRIEMNDGSHVGTGFFVKSNVIATNRHVLGDLTWGTEVISPGRSRIAMKREVTGGDQSTDIFSIDAVLAIHPTLDMVLLKVSGTGDRPVVPVDAVQANIATQVVALGYPADDKQRNPFFLNSVFQGKFGVKRASLGEILSGSADPNLFHDCSTTGGSSGSPLFSLATGKVIGIHRGGFFLYRNEAVCGAKLDDFIQQA